MESSSNNVRDCAARVDLQGSLYELLFAVTSSNQYLASYISRDIHLVNERLIERRVHVIA